MPSSSSSDDEAVALLGEEEEELEELEERERRVLLAALLSVTEQHDDVWDEKPSVSERGSLPVSVARSSLARPSRGRIHPRVYGLSL